MDASIPDHVASSFADSEHQGFVHLYRATATHRVDRCPDGWTHWGHVVPQLVDKPAVPPKTPDLSKRRERDVLAGPTYGRGELVLTVSSNTTSASSSSASAQPAQYALVHNLHALMPEHFMAIPLFGDDPAAFRPQTSDLVESDLDVTWRVVRAYHDKGREAVMFFNGGPLAGASQPHLHLQFCPFQYGLPPGPEALARASPSPPSASDPSAPAPRLALPWTNFYLPLPAAPDSLTLADLWATYQRLLRTSRAYLASQPEAALPEAGPKRESYNLFLTARHMHLVPRTDRLVVVPRVESARPGEEGGEFRLSLNGLLYLGYWYVGSEADWRDTQRLGLGDVLTRAAYRNEEYHG
ncbi:hypothetical protein Rhopal_007722-T1 [Rhodotorula paludigena]|uniref:ATP adenylyltransferase n=1 Tax=Rhodotorula paludigena TaxID=86838 RepID=A0AAV5GZJ8_9BASI|nr:hypothetical protein Rhopal_007722-T1 [Rhodotorula paludigena]